MRNIYILIILFLFTMCCVAQKKYYREEDILKIEKDFPDMKPWQTVYDSLLVKKKVLYFKNSPIDYLQGSMNILYDNIMVLPRIDHGYRLLWRIKGNKLYIKDISTYFDKYYEPILPREEQRKKLERFLGREFEKEGIFADFVTGKFILYKNALFLRGRNIKYLDNIYISYRSCYDRINNEYREEIKGKQEIYIAEFENGILIKLSRDKQREKEYKRWEESDYKIFEPLI